ncbi:DUF4064 domain-containing protein [Saccharibacillus endophyticus]|uniref:DUF4064 domain-containing protein n=1 Tax=Saccharibacillus endophyticus TaxID=2060666 RepID=A0ABQ2A2V8_9BACL|nr:DUF4064 domain-containing protein [Saccharibacillus endophyticus]GGH85101.1 hypothetical protein GCM10007362_41740 [Saccharibacillus endophyticus]
MDNRFPPSDGKDDRQNGPDLRKDPYRNESEPNNNFGDPYRSEPDGRGYDDRVNPPFSPYDSYPQSDYPQERLKHSGVGIASFVLSLISIALYVVFVVSAIGVVYSLAEVGSTVDFDVNSATEEQLMSVGLSAIVLIFSVLGAAVLNLVGAILGIVGIVSKTRKRVFAVIGTVLNGLCLLGGGGFIIFSTVIGAGGL